MCLCFTLYCCLWVCLNSDYSVWFGFDLWINRALLRFDAELKHLSIYRIQTELTVGYFQVLCERDDPPSVHWSTCNTGGELQCTFPGAGPWITFLALCLSNWVSVINLDCWNLLSSFLSPFEFSWASSWLYLTGYTMPKHCWLTLKQSALYAKLLIEISVLHNSKVPCASYSLNPSQSERTR